MTGPAMNWTGLDWTGLGTAPAAARAASYALGDRSGDGSGRAVVVTVVVMKARGRAATHLIYGANSKWGAPSRK